MPNRIDAHDKVTGRAIYAEDIYLPDMLYAVPLHAGIAHAEIKNIDLSRALRVDGVVDIITHKEITGEKRFGTVKKDHYFFAVDRVKYAGDVIAMIAAVSKEAAYKGRDLINVKYSPLPALFSPEDAIKTGAVKIHPETKNNECSHYKIRYGDTVKGFKDSHKIVEREYRTTHVEHAYMEPEACVAILNSDGGVTVRGGMQHPFTTQKFVSAATGLPLQRVQIVQTTLGGGFGGKDDTISVICARAALLAMRTKRPIKIAYAREESIVESYKRHPFRMKYKAGINKDGTLNTLEVDTLADAGAYCSTSPFVIWRPTVQCAGPYTYSNVKCDSRAVYTNNTFTGAMRGFGSPQINFAIESFMDELAEELKIDPVEFRRKTFFRQGCVTHTGQKLDSHKISLDEVMTTVLDKFGWKKKWKTCSMGRPDSSGNYHGIGMACSYRGVSLGAEGDDFCAAAINVKKNGSVELEVGVAENGQGLKTAMTIICAKELNVPIERISYLDVDTLRLPDSKPTVASRGTIVGGNAVISAAKQVLEKLGPYIGNGTFDSAVKKYFENNSELKTLGTWYGPEVSWDEENGQGNAYFTYVYACNAVEIKIDGKTGKITVVKMTGGHDMGHAVNPQMAMGQIYGGMVMGMGFAIKEAVIHKNGIIQNTNFDKYKIVTAPEVPEMDAIIVENNDPAGPWGAKSLGEPVNELMGAAIANAVFNATGVRIRELPITAEKIMQALKSNI